METQIGPHTDVCVDRNIEGFYSDTSLDDAVNAFSLSARDEFVKTSGFDRLAVYSNYAHGDEGAEAWYSVRKLARLSELKEKYDPTELFSVNLPIPLHWTNSHKGTWKATL